jgi:hypothetical protein
VENAIQPSVVTLKAYGDESADATKSHVFAVAAVFGTEDEWSLAMRKWLMRTRGLPFHATDCEAEFVHDSDRERHQVNLNLYRDLTQILAGSSLVGFGFALNLKDYQGVFPGLPTEWAYFKAFADLVGAAARTAKTFNDNSDGPNVRLEFTFDSRLESNGTAGAMYTLLASHPEWATAGILDTKIVFDSGACKSPRLEMGDLLARESMKEVERKITNDRRLVRKSRQALEETSRFRFIERDRAFWSALKEAVEKPESTALMNEFDQWLIQGGRVQHRRPARTVMNWVQFNAWLDNKASGMGTSPGSSFSPWP